MSLDPDLLCPVPFGTVLQIQNKLVAIGGGRRLEIQAPASLIRRVLTSCDGTRTVAELTRTRDGSTDQKLASFIGYLQDQGILIDANHLTMRALSYGQQMSPYGRTEPSFSAKSLRVQRARAELSGKRVPDAHHIRVSDNPITQLFHARTTTYVFDTLQTPSADDVYRLLWSLAGVVADRHPRLGDDARQHTLASAGALYLLTPYVILVQELGAYAPGVYRVDYPAEQTIALVRVSGLHELLPRAYARPDFLHGAAGAVVLAGDIETAARRYRNRATQYLCMEAGAALHNGALTAAGLDLGYAILGIYHEDVLARMCDLPGNLNVLGTAIFGVRDVKIRERRDPSLTFLWADDPSAPYPLAGYLARVSRPADAESGPHSWGYHRDPAIAHLKAGAEYIERQGMRQPGALVEATRAGLKGALDPALFVRYSPKQLAQKNFPFRPLNDQHPTWWAQAVRCRDGEPRHVLAQLVHPAAALAPYRGKDTTDTQEQYVQCTTSGCAAGISTQDALERALLELIERDAFMRHWFKQRPGSTLAEDALPADTFHRLKVLREAGCKVGIQRLVSDLAIVILAWAQHEGMAFTTLGCAARSTLDESLEAAIGELESRAYVWLNGMVPPSAARARDVRSFSDHFALYGTRRHFKRADQVLTQGHASKSEDPLVARLAGTALQRLEAAGYDPIYVDITPQHNTLNAGRTVLRVIKALVPGLIPLSCGYGLEPLGLVEDVHTGALFPHPFP